MTESNQIQKKLTDLGLSIPTLNPPLAAYVPAKREGRYLYISGQLPLKDGQLMSSGLLTQENQVSTAQVAMQQCFLNGLAAASTVCDPNQIQGILRLGAYVASSETFHWQHLVANGASELALNLFGDPGRHTRSAIGVSSLPLNASVELDIVFTLDAS